MGKGLPGERILCKMKRRYSPHSDEKERTMRKRTLAFLVTVAAAMSLLILPGAGAQPDRGTYFSDVPEEAWYYDYVTDLYEAGVIDGYAEGIFAGDLTVTWGQTFKLITLAIGCEEPEPVEGERWDYPYIELALDNRLVYAFDEDYLEESPTRLQVARMVARALDLLSIPQGESPFADCDDGYVTHLYEKGILEGEYDESGRLVFVPDEAISRAEMAAIIWRVYNLDVTEGTFRYSNYWIEPFSADEVEPFGYDASLFSLDGEFMTYGDGSVPYEIGVDVSEHKLEIDWQAVADAGVDFAIIRIGGRLMQSGGLYEDAYFRANLEGAKAAGLKVGVYFFSQAITVEEAGEEGDFVLEYLDGYDLTYPVVFDWEVIGTESARTYGLDTETLCACANTFCSMVEEAGYEAMIYLTSYAGYIKYDLSQVMEYDFWLAQYSDTPDFYYDFQMWQYSSTGSVDGISGDVDLNLQLIQKE